MNGKVEALEFIVSPDFGYTGIPVKQLDLKPDILLAGIIRGGKNIIHVEEGLNHLFQHCVTGEFSEYKEIEETFSPKVLSEMIAWIKTL